MSPSHDDASNGVRENEQEDQVADRWHLERRKRWSSYIIIHINMDIFSISLTAKPAHSWILRIPTWLLSGRYCMNCVVPFLRKKKNQGVEGSHDYIWIRLVSVLFTKKKIMSVNNLAHTGRKFGHSLKFTVHIACVKFLLFFLFLTEHGWRALASSV
jgi:hypothetical protein